jgi:Zn-dependent M16 (insulinase) family peptidase
MGEVGFYSFRDPSPSGAIAAYEGAPGFLREYCGSGADISSYIISSIAQKEPLISDRAYGTIADEIFFRGITEEKRRENRKRMLSLKAEDLLAAVPSLEKSGRICVIGSAEAISACGDDFASESV